MKQKLKFTISLLAILVFLGTIVAAFTTGATSVIITYLWQYIMPPFLIVAVNSTLVPPYILDDKALAKLIAVLAVIEYLAGLIILSLPISHYIDTSYPYFGLSNDWIGSTYMAASVGTMFIVFIVLALMLVTIMVMIIVNAIKALWKWSGKSNDNK